MSLIEQRFGGGDRALRLFNLGGRFEALFVQHPNIHPRQHLALVNKLPLFDQNGVDASGSFGGDIHLGGLNSAVAAGKAVRQPRRTQHPPRHGGGNYRETDNAPGPMSF